jgi:hypothetical protein
MTAADTWSAGIDAPSCSALEKPIGVPAAMTLRSPSAVLQMYLLQSPLRPPWRPYDLEAAESVRVAARSLGKDAR